MFSEYISSHSNLVWANVSAMYSVSDIGPTFWYCIYQNIFNGYLLDDDFNEVLSFSRNHNHVGILAQEFLTFMPQLQVLELNHNLLTDIVPGVFPANNSLQKL